jgi:Na+/proline symporter
VAGGEVGGEVPVASYLKNPKARALREASPGMPLVASRVVLTLLALLAIPIVIEPRATIWRWTEIEFEGLIQVLTAILLSLYVPWVNAKGVLSGMVVGAVVALALSLSGYTTVQGIHAGMIGLVVNIVTCLAVSRATVKESEVGYARSLITPT